MTAKVFNMKAQEVGTVKLNKDVFGAEFKPALIHEVVVAHAANARQGTKSALGRGEVRGGKKKPHRQKGTGRARQGSTVSIHHIGGGVAFAPKPRDFDKKVNREAKRTALRSALSQKLTDGNIIFLKDLDVKETVNKEGKIVKHAKTKEIVAMLEKFKLDRTTLIVMGDNNVAARRAIRNLERTESCLAKLLNVTDVVKFTKIIIVEDAVKVIEEVLA
ncbi:MAG: 50S ribosomal protein L4 [Firmicutes bacterium]|nr:50S ribosomal protein L4 [Bacillota bacterium]MCL2770826.1 50S ribosomal protein L4 [Bacillota bacterium]